MGMSNFFAELKRRHIYRVAAAYAVVAWVLIQLVNNLAPMLRLPDWAGSFFLVLLLVGFPVVLLIAWIHQLAPEDGALAHVTTGKLDWALIGALVVVIALLSYQQFAPTFETVAVTQKSGVVAAREAASTAAGAISIAVLPFVNLSDDRQQEFFSDGMTEEITGALAKISDLRVVARTSAFEFKGQNRDIQAIGQALRATHLIEGSVRKAGTRVRITAQLIKTDDGTHIWSENYDRELTDVFAIQEDIAQAIAGALRVPLGLQPGSTLITNRTANLDLYEQYLRARALHRARSDAAAIHLLEEIVARDASFGPAWGELAQVYVRDDQWDKAKGAAQEAIRLDPRNAAAYAALADVDSIFGRWTAGEDAFQQALALDPNEPDVIHRYSVRLAVAGRLKEALSIRQKLHSIEPFVPVYNANTARFMVSVGQTQAAIAILENIPADALVTANNRNLLLARAYAMEGRYTEAANALLEVPPPPQSGFSRRSIEDAARLLRSVPERVGPPETLPALEGQLNFVYAYVGALDRVLEEPERAVRLRDQFRPFMDVLWQPEAAPLRKTERFKKFVRDSGLYDYWRERGWSDACRPLGENDFVCD